jgi:hypothetical protein
MHTSTDSDWRAYALQKEQAKREALRLRGEAMVAFWTGLAAALRRLAAFSVAAVDRGWRRTDPGRDGSLLGAGRLAPQGPHRRA